MLSKKSAMSVIAGVTMLVLPASVFAGNFLRSNDGNLAARVAQVESPQIELVKSHRGFHRVCDADGDDCRWVPNNIANNADSYYQCDADGDDCRWVNGYGPRYWRDYGYDYGAPFSWYGARPPARYNLAQRRSWLIAKRQRAYHVLAQMRARGDRHAEQRMIGVIENLNAQIANMNRQMSGEW